LGCFSTSHLQFFAIVTRSHAIQQVFTGFILSSAASCIIIRKDLLALASICFQYPFLPRVYTSYRSGTYA